MKTVTYIAAMILSGGKITDVDAAIVEAEYLCACLHDPPDAPPFPVAMPPHG